MIELIMRSDDEVQAKQFQQHLAKFADLLQVTLAEIGFASSLDDGRPDVPLKALSRTQTERFNRDLVFDLAQRFRCHLRCMLIGFELLFKLMAFERAQFRRRNRLATERELQHLADVGLDQGVDFLLGGPLAAKRFTENVARGYNVFAK